jgi:uncharacterized SAM-binding protein YcdF (DUF218 family)
VTLRRVFKWAVVIAGLAFLFWLVSLFQVWTAGRSADRTPVDALIVLGAAQYDGRPSPQLQARLDHAFELWNLNLASFIVVTGGKQTGDRFTEAQAAKKFFTSKGVSSDLIFEENTGTTTYESLLAVSQIATERKISRVLIVSDPFHMLRAKLIAQEVGLIAFTSATQSSVIRDTAALRRNMQEAVGITIGRVVGFRRVDSWSN